MLMIVCSRHCCNDGPCFPFCCRVNFRSRWRFPCLETPARRSTAPVKLGKIRGALAALPIRIQKRERPISLSFADWHIFLYLTWNDPSSVWFSFLPQVIWTIGADLRNKTDILVVTGSRELSRPGQNSDIGPAMCYMGTVLSLVFV